MNNSDRAVLAGAAAYTSASTILTVLAAYNTYTHFSLLTSMGLIASIMLLTPVKTIMAKADNPSENLTKFYSNRKTTITYTTLIFSLTSVFFLTGSNIPVVQISNITFTASTNFFRQLLYLEPPLDSIGIAMFEFGRFYFHGFVIYTLVDTAQTLIQKIAPEKDEGEFKASLTPFSGEDARIEIYVVSGIQGFFRIPESFCKECNLFYQAANKASEESNTQADVQVKSYWTRFLRPLLKGGYHPPVILVDGKIVGQGYNVPEKQEIKDMLN